MFVKGLRRAFELLRDRQREPAPGSILELCVRQFMLFELDRIQPDLIGGLFRNIVKYEDVGQRWAALLDRLRKPTKVEKQAIHWPLQFPGQPPAWIEWYGNDTTDHEQASWAFLCGSPAGLPLLTWLPFRFFDDREADMVALLALFASVDSVGLVNQSAGDWQLYGQQQTDVRLQTLERIGFTVQREPQQQSPLVGRRQRRVRQVDFSLSGREAAGNRLRRTDQSIEEQLSDIAHDLSGAGRTIEDQLDELIDKAVAIKQDSGGRHGGPLSDCTRQETRGGGKQQSAASILQQLESLVESAKEYKKQNTGTRHVRFALPRESTAGYGTNDCLQTVKSCNSTVLDEKKETSGGKRYSHLENDPLLKVLQPWFVRYSPKTGQTTITPFIADRTTADLFKHLSQWRTANGGSETKFNHAFVRQDLFRRMRFKELEQGLVDVEGSNPAALTAVLYVWPDADIDRRADVDVINADLKQFGVQLARVERHTSGFASALHNYIENLRLTE
jgi:hypothetical protein